MSDFKFKDEKSKIAFTCCHIIDENSPILYAAHDDDGDWQFLCGLDHHTEDDAKVVSLEQIVEIDNTINHLYEMPIGVGAERKAVRDKWVPFSL